METVTVYLDSLKKHRNTKEYTTIPRAYTTYKGKYYEAVGYGEVIKNLLYILVEEKADINTQVEVMRGDTSCFALMAIKRWLSMDDCGRKIDRRPTNLKKGKRDE